MNMLSNTIQNIADIANIILAGTAVISLLVAIKALKNSTASSKELSEGIAAIKNGVIHYTEPLVKMIDYSWIKDTREPLSKDNTPVGIQVLFSNSSPVPAIIYKTTLKVFYGEYEFKEIVKTYGSTNAQHIMGTNEILGVMSMQKENFRKYITEKSRLLDQPCLVIELLIEYSSLKDQKRFLYHTKQETHFDALEPEKHLRQAEFELVKLI